MILGANPTVTLRNAIEKKRPPPSLFKAFCSVTPAAHGPRFTRGGSSQFCYSLAWLGWALRKNRAMCFARSLICSWCRPLLRLRSDSLRHQRQLELLRRLARSGMLPSCSWASPCRLGSRASPCRRGACLSWFSSWLRMHRSLVLPRRGHGWLLPLHQPLEIGGAQAPQP